MFAFCETTFTPTTAEANRVDFGYANAGFDVVSALPTSTAVIVSTTTGGPIAAADPVTAAPAFTG